MLPREQFDNFKPHNDHYASRPVTLSFDGLEPKGDIHPKLSILISTYNRRNQLSRSFECLARQEFKNFEILLMDDGSTEDIKSLCDLFEPYLHIKYFRTVREKWRSCPSRAYKAMFPHVNGDVIAVMHPEMILDNAATEYLYRGAVERLEDANYGLLEDTSIQDGDWYWVSLRPNFFNDFYYNMIDSIDWHSAVINIQTLPRWMENSGGFAGWNNAIASQKIMFPWWFVGAAKKDCPIWKDMPIFDGHGIIDMWMINYRKKYNIIDCVPNGVMCYHQPHQTSAVAPIGEQDNVKI